MTKGTSRYLKKKLLPLMLTAAMCVTGLTGLTAPQTRIMAAETVYGTKPTQKTISYDLSKTSGLGKTVLWKGDKIAVSPENSKSENDVYYCKDCKKWSAEFYYYANGIVLNGDTSAITTKSQKVTYVKDANLNTGTKSVITLATVNSSAPVMVYSSGSPKKTTTNVKCQHNRILQVYNKSFNYPITVEQFPSATFTVSYDLNGGVVNGTENATTFRFSDKDYSYKLNTPVKLGYSMQWVETHNNTGNVSVSPEQLYVCALDYSFWEIAKKMVENGGLNLKAKWTAADISYKIILDEENPGRDFAYFEAKAGEKNRLTKPLGEVIVPEGYRLVGYFMGDTEIKCLKDIPSSMWNKNNYYQLVAKFEKLPETSPTPTATATPTPTPTPEPREDAFPDYENYFGIEEIFEGFNDSDIFYNGNSEDSAPARAEIAYIPEENTLKLNGYEGTAIFTEAMGSAFKMELTGSNSLETIYSRAGEYNGNVTLTGNGSLTLGGDNQRDGILIKCDGTDTQLVIADGVSLKIAASEGKCAIRVLGSSNPEPIKLGENEQLVDGKIVITQVEDPETGAITYNAEITERECQVVYHEPPKKPAYNPISKLTSTKAKTITVSYKKLENVDGYQIRCSTSEKMTSAKYVTTTATKKSVSVMKSNTTYYVQVRAFVKDASGNKTYATWSKKKSIKTM